MRCCIRSFVFSVLIHWITATSFCHALVYEVNGVNLRDGKTVLILNDFHTTRMLIQSDAIKLEKSDILRASEIESLSLEYFFKNSPYIPGNTEIVLEAKPLKTIVPGRVCNLDLPPMVKSEFKNQSVPLDLFYYIINVCFDGGAQYGSLGKRKFALSGFDNRIAIDDNLFDFVANAFGDDNDVLDKFYQYLKTHGKIWFEVNTRFISNQIELLAKDYPTEIALHAYIMSSFKQVSEIVSRIDWATLTVEEFKRDYSRIRSDLIQFINLKPDLNLLRLILRSTNQLIVVHAGGFHSVALFEMLKSSTLFDGSKNVKIVEDFHPDAILDGALEDKLMPSIDSIMKVISCNQCHKGGKLLKCSACKGASYCSAACQRKDWPKHKIVCNVPTLQ